MFSGCFVAVVTPFRKGEVDLPALHALVDELVAAKFLWVNAHGAYARLPDGDVSRLRTAQASVQRFVSSRQP